jgi:hypothetical protein
MSYQSAAQQEQPPSQKEALAEAIDAAYLAEGYVTEGGERDQAALAGAIYPLVARARVENPQERTAKAVTRGDLLAAVFPSLPKREDWPAQPDPDLAEEVDKAIRQKVWDLVKPDKAGYVQQLVGTRTPNLILCRTKIGTDGVDAVYVTDNLACIKEDFANPLADAMRRANRRMSLNMAMAGSRLPEHARTFDRLFRQANKRALTAGLADTQLMLESADDDNGVDGDE